MEKHLELLRRNLATAETPEDAAHTAETIRQVEDRVARHQREREGETD